MLMIRDIEVAAARIALAPAVSGKTANDMKAVPVTRPMGINLSGSIRAMANIIANSHGAKYFTTAEVCSDVNNYRLQVWRLPAQ